MAAEASTGALRRAASELKRRGVPQALGGYLVWAWVVVTVADVVLPALGAPDQAMTVLVCAPAAGLPDVLVVSWMFDLRRSGLVRDRSTAPTATEALRTGLDKKSIAVLPFADLSAEGDQEYFAAGIAEELTNSLSAIPGLRVAARTSTLRFKGESVDFAEIGRALGVGSVVAVSIRKASDRIRISTRLVDVETGFDLFSEKFDRPFDDVFAVQDEISRSLAETLRVELLAAGEDRRMDTTASESTAYDLYLQGRHFWHRRYAVGLDTALKYFQRALEVDRDFALPYAGIADTLSVKGMWGFAVDAREEAHAAVEKARTLGPGRPESLFAEGLVSLVFGGDWWKAEQAFEAAIVLRPNFGEAFGWLGLLRAAHGRTRAARDSMRQALEIEPDSPYVVALVAYGHLWLRDYQEAVDISQTLADGDPESIMAMQIQSIGWAGLGDFASAQRTIRTMLVLTNRADLPLALSSWMLSAGGRKEEGLEYAEELLGRGETRGVGAVMKAIAEVTARPEKAVETLRAGHREGAAGTALVHRYPFWDDLRATSEWRGFMDDLGVVIGEEG